MTAAPSSRVRSWLRPLTLPASRIYAAAIPSRNRKFDRGVGVKRIDRPVISVGNLTTGGTGKTPMVAWIARHLLAAGALPAIAMRGYKARPGEPSDEQAEYRSILPDVPVLANPDRHAELRKFLPQHREIDCVLLDDGFQHRQLHRDLNLVLLDASRDTFHDELLPAGNLREPLDSLARADAVIVTHAREIDHGLAQEIERWHGRPAIAWTDHVWNNVSIHLSDGRSKSEPATCLRGQRVLTLLGVGNPNAVIAQLEQAGAKVMANIPAGDHEHFEIAKLAVARGLCDGLDAMVVTRKDWVKIQPLLPRLARWPTPIVVPQLEIEFMDGEARLVALLEQSLRQCPSP